MFVSYGVAAGAVPRTANFGVNPDGTLFRSGAPGTNYRPDGDACVGCLMLRASATTVIARITCRWNNTRKLRCYVLRYELSSNATLFARRNIRSQLCSWAGQSSAGDSVQAAGLTVPVPIRSSPQICARCRGPTFHARRDVHLSQKAHRTGWSSQLHLLHGHLPRLIS